jgi:thiol:disulfide interchange protein DsbA
MYLLRLFIFMLLSLSFTAIAHAEEDDPFLGTYNLIDRPQKVLEAGKVEVAELFLYTCPHCLHFEPMLKEWQKKYANNNVTVFQIPAVFGDNNIPLAKAFYVADTLKLLDKMHPLLFDAIQEKHQKLSTEAELQAFFVKQGIEEKAFTEAYNSFAVDSKVRQARVLTQAYGISSVPNVVVNGKYRLSPGQTETTEQLLKAADFLIAKELKLLAKPTDATSAK